MSVDLSIDVSNILAAGRIFERAGKEAPKAISRAINHTGDKAKTQVTRALVAQTGLKRPVIVRAVKPTRASLGSLSYVLKSRGGDVRLQFFSPREKGGGTEARPWNKPRIYAGAFTRQGFVKRVPFTKPGMAGHVFKRKGKGRLPIAQAKSGLFIAEEMIKGASEAAFQQSVAADLPGRLDHELSLILSGKVK